MEVDGRLVLGVCGWCGGVWQWRCQWSDLHRRACLSASSSLTRRRCSTLPLNP